MGRSTQRWEWVERSGLLFVGAPCSECWQESVAMENELGRFVDALPGFIWTALPDGHCDFFNRLWCEYTGLSLQEAAGQRWLSVVHPEDLPNVLLRWRAMLASGETGELEARLRRSDGAYRWFSIASRPLRDDSGKVVKWCGLNTDIEDRKQAEALRRNEDLSSIIDTIPMTAWSTGPDGYCDFLNQRWLDYAGLTLDEARGWGWGAVIHPDDRDRLLADWQVCLASGAPVHTEARMRRFDGVPASASHPQLAHECLCGDDRRRRPPAAVGDPNRAR